MIFDHLKTLYPFPVNLGLRDPPHFGNFSTFTIKREFLTTIPVFLTSDLSYLIKKGSNLLSKRPNNLKIELNMIFLWFSKLDQGTQFLPEGGVLPEKVIESISIII